jgi:DHA2 family multidrug resistance protein
VNLKLLKDRTFSSGCIVMFFVFLNLFGSIVLLPIFLQLLMGYTSYDAGLVLGPGGLAVLISMPIAGKLVSVVNPKRILFAGICLCALSTYMMSQFNLTTDFWTFVWPRAALGLGMGLTFIPLTTMTLSHIPREQMTEASSLYNLLRNLGGSMGIAITTTLLAQRAQLHQARLVEHLSPLDTGYQYYHDKIGSFLGAHGLLPSGADGIMYRELVRQSTALAFNDAFLFICMLMVSILPLVFLMEWRPSPVKPPDAH